MAIDSSITSKRILWHRDPEILQVLRAPIINGILIPAEILSSIYSVKPIASLRQLRTLSKLIMLPLSYRSQSVIFIIIFLRIRWIYLISMVWSCHALMHVLPSLTKVAFWTVGARVSLAKAVAGVVADLLIRSVTVLIIVGAEWSCFRIDWYCIQFVQV